LWNRIKGAYKNIYDGIINSLMLRSLQFVITISFAVVTILVILFVGLTLYKRFELSAEKNTSLNANQLTDQINSNIEYYLSSMIKVSDSLEQNIYLDRNIPNLKLQDQMNVLHSTREDIASLAIFSDRGELIMGTSADSLKDNAHVVNADWFNTALYKSEHLFFSPPHVQNLFQGNNQWVVSLSRAINYYQENELVKGVLLVDMNFSTIGELCQNVSIGKRGYIYIVDADNNIIYHPQQQLINLGLKTENNQDFLGTYVEPSSEGNRLITVKSVRYTNWKLVAVSYMSELVTSRKNISNFLIFVLLFCTMFIIFIFIFISDRISRPIKQLEKYMKRVEEGEFDIYIDVKGEDEVVRLSKAFNIMVSKIRNLMDQVIIEQEAKRKSELEALQSQINPHFLYNTLDSIVWMSENKKNEEVIKMITSLAKLFRISISRGKNIITVEQEIEHARNYLIIQKVRYKNKFEFEITAEEQVLKYKTLKLILQPLIENAIYHGIEYMVDEGTIKISASEVDGKLLMQVSDNGLGIEPEKLENLLQYETKSEAGSGVGIKNVHERIQLRFGKEYGLEVESELEEGTCIKIWLPLIKD
jgi:two-component system sensor histidine kinase YesM